MANRGRYSQACRLAVSRPGNYSFYGCYSVMETHGCIWDFVGGDFTVPGDAALARGSLGGRRGEDKRLVERLPVVDSEVGDDRNDGRRLFPPPCGREGSGRLLRVKVI